MKLVNFDKWDSQPYCEIGQTNPIRWMNVKPVGEDTYEPVSHWWKCKDFMNEAVTSFHLKKSYSIYGFTADPSSFYAPGQQDMFVLLKHIVPEWEHNIETVNSYLKEQGFPTVTWSKEKAYYLVTIPNAFLKNTLFISQITLFIRMANVQKKVNTIEELSKVEWNASEIPLFQACMKKPLGKFPKQLEVYVWYYNKSSNLKHTDVDKPVYTSHMHNCGVVAWGWN